MSSFFSFRNFWNGNKAIHAVEDKIHRYMMETGAQAVRDARHYVPVDTGQLRDSIGFTYRQSDFTLTLHADMHYAFFVEFGTRFMEPRPFLRPALLSASPFWANTALQFGQIRTRRPIPMPKASSEAIRRGNITNRVIDRQFSAFTGRKAPRIEFMGKSSKSTPHAVGRFGAGNQRIQNVSWKKILRS